MSNLSTFDDSLLPPSAFVNRSFENIKFETKQSKPHDRESFFLDSFSQTKSIRTVSTSTSPIYQLYELDEFCRMLDEKSIKNAKYLKNELDKCNHENIEIVKKNTELNDQLNILNRRNQDLSDDLSKMKFYISGVANREEWIKEKQQLHYQLELARNNTGELESIIESLKKQHNNMEKIMTIQEEELQKSLIKESPHKFSVKENQVEKLLKTWRHKVLSLMVQHDSDELCFRSDKQKLTNNLRCVEDKLIELNDENEQLSLKLQNAQQQISDINMVNEKFSHENHCLKEQVNLLYVQVDDNEEVMESIKQKLISFEDHMLRGICNQFHSQLNKLEMLERRLEYGISRFPIIKTILCRQNYLGKSEYDKSQSEVTKDIALDDVQQINESLMIMKKEMDKLREERDKLCHALEHDSETFEDRIRSKKQEIQDELEYLRKKVCEYEDILSKLQKENEVIQRENVRLKESYDKLMSDKLSESEDLHKIIGQSRNELAQIKLEASQLKRTVNKHKEEFNEKCKSHQLEMRTLEDEWRQKMENVAIECDMLKSTIKQEGILTRLQAQLGSSGEENLNLEENNSVDQELNADTLMEQIKNLTSSLSKSM